MVHLIPIGFFRELKHGNPTGPSLREAQRMHRWAHQAEIVDYLKNGVLLVASMGVVTDILGGGDRIIGSPSILTDSVFAWPEDLAYYVDTYNVAVPDSFIENAIKKKWSMPTSIDVHMLDLNFG